MTCTNSQGKCDASTRPKAEELCEDYSGCYEWRTGDWSKVSPAPAPLSRPGHAGDTSPGLSCSHGLRFEDGVPVKPGRFSFFPAQCLPVTTRHVQFERDGMSPKAQSRGLRCHSAVP